MRCIETQKFPTKYSMIITDWSIWNQIVRILDNITL
jgi:hypothetical protein